MLDTIIGMLPSGSVILCTVLSFAVPYAIETINKKIHEFADPPWKKQ